jgi:hypothetical protein
MTWGAADAAQGWAGLCVELAAPELTGGLLEPALEEFTPSRESLFIYLRRRSGSQWKLMAFVEVCAR